MKKILITESDEIKSFDEIIKNIIELRKEESIFINEKEALNEVNYSILHGILKYIED